MARLFTADLAPLIEGICLEPVERNVLISGLQLDSRKVVQGDLFIAISRDAEIALAHVRQALERGAVAVLIDSVVKDQLDRLSLDAEVLSVVNISGKVGELADRFYCSPSQQVCVIGITGTNGKTSVANYLANLMSLAGVESGVIGTIGYGLVSQPLIETGYTTPDVVSVHKCLAELKAAGAEYVMMEVSSHGLDQGRVDNVLFTGAVFTNLSREHLDYHGSMTEYAAAKSKLFESEGLKFAVMNGDDPAFEQIRSVLSAEAKLVTFGFGSDNDVRATHESYQEGISALINTPIGEVNLNCELLGQFNLSNVMAVIATVIALDEPVSRLAFLDQLKAVPGRMQMVQVADKPVVIIDYAHTPDALKNALAALKEHCRGDLVVVFGCGGDRDQGKRPEMAAVAEQYADAIYITDDNPRSETPAKIVADILAGFSDKIEVNVIHDRAEAIDRAIAEAAQDDWVLVAGKGHETYQEISGTRYPFSDIDVAREKLGVSVSEVSGDD